MDNNKKYIFMSYAHLDESFKQVLDKLHNKFGFNILYDEGLTYGQNWIESVEKYIKSSNCVGCIFLLGRKSVISKAVHKEMDLVTKYKKPYFAITDYIDSLDNLFKTIDENTISISKLEKRKYLKRCIKFFHRDKLFLDLSELIGMEAPSNKLLNTFSEWGIKSENRSPNYQNDKYSSNIDGEKERLEVQSDNYTRIDDETIGIALDNLYKDNIVVLDLGCSNGKVAYSRFYNRKNVSKVIGIDVNEKDIESANEKYGGSKFSFYKVDLNSYTAIDEIKKILGNEKVDLVFFALTIHHLEKPQNLLVKLNEIISQGGQIIIRTSDDGTKICYPYMDELNQIIERYDRLIKTTDRYSGRKIYSYLRESGYTNINYHYSTVDTVGLTYEERKTYFNVGFGFRLNRFKDLVKKYPDNEDYKRECDWLEKALQDFESKFLSDGFYYALTTYVIIATANERK